MKNKSAHKPSKPVVKAAAPKKIAVSAGVMQGNVLVRTTPQYPAIAKAARSKPVTSNTKATAKVKKKT